MRGPQRLRVPSGDSVPSGGTGSGAPGPSVSRRASSSGNWVALHPAEFCHYRLEAPGQQPLGRIEPFLKPIRLDPQGYGGHPDARLVSPLPIGVDRRLRIVEETLHLIELDAGRRRRLRLRALLPARERLSGAVCSLVDSRDWCGSYYHWFLDALPRLLYAEEHRRCTGETVRLIVPAQLNPWQGASLQLLDVEEQRLVPWKAPGGGGVAVEVLLAGVAHRWQRLGGAPFDAASPWAVRWLADRLSAAVPSPTTDLPRRLWLSRRGVASRGVVNEEVVLELLRPNGFESVQTETLSLAEQIALFRGATHIVAPHGASLTNLIHMRGGSVLELFQAGHGVRPDFFQLAMISGCNYLHALCPASEPGHHITVPLEVIREFLDLSL